MNIVLIDFESVQPESLAPLAQDHFKVLVFVGANQAKLSFEVAASLQQLGPRAEYIKISGNGPNALDFHIAYYIGRLAAADGAAYFYIVSKDTGFDPLIQHLKSRGVFAARVKAITDIPPVKATAAKSPAARSHVAPVKSPADRLHAALAWLWQTKASKPRTVKTLGNALGALFQKQVSAEDVTGIIEALAKQGHLSISGNKVTYSSHGAS